MKTSFLLLIVSILALTSCTSMYKTGQTPDDVYYSPTRPQDEYVQMDRRDVRGDDRRYQNDDDYYDDRYLRMRVSNRNRWSELDDYYYYGNRYNYYYYPTTSFYYNPWTPNSYWNTFYNPYYSGGYYGSPVYGKPTNVTYNRPRTTNLNTYNNNMLTNRQYSVPSRSSANSSNNVFNRANAAGSRNGNAGYNNTRSSDGNGLRNVFGNNNNNSSNNNSNAPARSNSTPSSSSSSSSTPAGSSNAPVRRF